MGRSCAPTYRSRGRDSRTARGGLAALPRTLAGATVFPTKEDHMALELETAETSFGAPRGEELVDVFYRRRFEAAPSVKLLFARDAAA